MIVKRFTGKTAEEALAMAKWELGEDAIILSSGKARESWWKFWQSGFQVLVATDYSRRSAATAAHEAAPTVLADDQPVVTPVVQVTRLVPHSESVQPAGGVDGHEWGRVIHLLEGLEERLDRMGPQSDIESSEAYEWFRLRGVSELWAHKLAEAAAHLQTADPELALHDAIRQSLLERLAPPSPIALAEPATVLFIGPTGSGKTTTIAKLAAYCHLERQKSVLLISTDTFRVAAVEQLRTYSEIIGVPFQIALRPQDIPHILKDRQWDVVLIDTAGHSFNHSLYMAEIRSIAELSQANDIQLVLPATMDASLMCETALKFGEGLSPKISFTKTDEVRHLGSVLTTALTLGWPLAYLTDGQNVPDDIQVAFPETVIKLLDGGTP